MSRMDEIKARCEFRTVNEVEAYVVAHAEVRP